MARKLHVEDHSPTGGSEVGLGQYPDAELNNEGHTLPGHGGQD